MDIETFCFAWGEGAICKYEVDHFYPISIIDFDKILKVCQQNQINGIVSNASDTTARTVSYIAEQLKLNGTPYDVFNKLQDKQYIRKLLEEVSFFEQIKYYQYQGIDKELYPCVVKPCIGNAKKGVSMVNNKEEMAQAIKYASNNNTAIIVEEYITGKEISVESISFHGQHYILQITDKDSSAAPHFTELGHHQPAQIPSIIKEKIFLAIPELLNKIGYTDGASHIEIKYCNHKLYLIEVNLRGGGDEISNQLVFMSTGIDYLKCMIEVALNTFRFPCVKHSENKRFAGIYFLCQQTAKYLPFFKNAIGKEWLVKTEIYSEKLIESNSNYERNGYLIYNSNRKISPNDNNIYILNEKGGEGKLIAKDFLHLINNEEKTVISEKWIDKIFLHARIISYFEKDKIIGWFVLYCNDQESKIAYCASLHVLRPYRGEGIGSILIKVAIETCLKEGMKKITLYCKVDNTSALYFYKKNNFKELYRGEQKQYDNEEYAFLELQLQ